MAVLFFDGCGEFYDTANVLDAWDTHAGATVNATGGRRSGAALEFTQSQNVSKTVPKPGDDTLIFGFAFKIPTQVANELVFFQSNTTTQINLDTTAAGEIRVERNGTLLDTTATNTYLADTWHFCECKVVIGNSPNGSVVLKIDGTEVSNLSGIDTQSGSVTGIDRLAFVFGTGAGIQATIDDVYICDTSGGAPGNDFLGDIQVDAVMPDGDGAATEWDSTFPASPTNHWSKVDENPDDGDTTYNETVTVNDVDLFTFPNLPAVGGGSSVIAVDVKAKQRRVDGAFANTQLVARPVTTQYVSGNKPQSVSYMMHNNIWETNPEGGSWTDSSINSSQFGVKLV
ncbi:MAG: hypothetical protein ACYSUC_02205 [Planctomycetota bacterium]|jgi:hypothetical protein